MLHWKIKQDYPFAADFFQTVLNNNDKLASSYLLIGNNILSLYFIALEIARELNCKEKTEDCNCINCMWTAENKHPAIITISPVDYIHANRDGKPKTVISIDQARSLKNTLAISSAYSRVVIFTGAEEGNAFKTKADFLWKEYRNFIKPPSLENSSAERLNWIPVPLDYKILHSEPANALLKTIEEPPQGVTFIFLAKDREDMLETIVSRSQTIYVTSSKPEKAENFLPESLISAFPPKNITDSIFISENIMKLLKDDSISAESVLDMLEEHYLNLIRQNINNHTKLQSSDNLIAMQVSEAGASKDYDKRFSGKTERLAVTAESNTLKAHSYQNNFRKLLNIVKKIQHSRLELKSYVSPQSVFDSLTSEMI